MSFVKLMWTCSAVDLDTVGVRIGWRGRLVSFVFLWFLFVVLFHERVGVPVGSAVEPDDASAAGRSGR